MNWGPDDSKEWGAPKAENENENKNNNDTPGMPSAETEVNASPSAPVLPILHSPLPTPVISANTYDPPNFRMKLTEDSPLEELLDAIRITKESADEVQAASDVHEVTSNRVRDQITQLNYLLEQARAVRNEADGNIRELRITEGKIKREIAWLQDLYTSAIAKGRDRERLNKELEFYEMLARTKKWGARAFDFQLAAAKQMALEDRVVLGDEMGLGKTLTSIIAADMSRAAKVLVFTQNDILSNFAREVGKWSDDRVLVVLGSYKDKFARHLALKSLMDQPAFVVLVNYEMWRRDKEVLKLLIECKFDTVIIDEAHNMKDEKGQNFTGIRQIVYAENKDWQCQHCGYEFDRWPYADLCDECVRPLGRRNFDDRCSVKRVYPMTGTSILNDPADAFPMLHLIDRIAFPDKKTYLQRYCKQEEVESMTGSWVKKWFFKWGGEEMLIRKLGAKYIRRTLEDAGITLPPQDEQEHILRFEDGEYLEQRKVIAAINKFNAVLLNDMGDTADIPTLLAMITRSRQAITYPAGIKFYDKDENNKPVLVGQCEVTQSIKVDYSVKLIKGFLEAGQKVVLFSQFKAPLKRIEELLNAEGITRVVRYDGDIPKDRLDWIATQADAGFTDKKEMAFDVMLVNYRKGGTGVNFTNFRQMILLDREWNPAKEDQAKHRTHRIGQTETTTVHTIRVEGSIDDIMDALIDRKREVADGFNNQIEKFSLIEYLNKKFRESP